MEVQKMAMNCSGKNCNGQEFVGEFVVNAPVDVFLTSLKSNRCPKCGSSKKVNILYGEVGKAARERLGLTP